MDAISEEDLALFQQAAQESFQRMVARNQEACPDAGSRTFPLAEPDYNAKRPLDLTPFADALAAFDPRAARHSTRCWPASRSRRSRRCSTAAN